MESLRECIKCKGDKPLPSFKIDKRNTEGRAGVCKECSNLEAMHRKRGNKIIAIEYLGNSCEHCGIEYDGNNATIFDFHHLDPDEKEFKPAALMSRHWDNIIEELDKCILLCSNCHRIEHHGGY